MIFIAAQPARQAMASRMHSSDIARQRGFTYLWLLAAMAVLGIAMAAVGPTWANRIQREREDDLLRFGLAYAHAIESYYAMTPGADRYPHSLQDLLEDRRSGSAVHHLRSAYWDPLLPEQALALVRNESGGIVGVRSNSTAAPLRQTIWTDGRHTLQPAARYCDQPLLAATS